MEELLAQPSFPEFVDWLQSCKMSHNLLICKKKKNGNKLKKKIKRFLCVNFLTLCNSDWLVENRAGRGASPSSWSKDNTWVPFYTVCPVCQLPYTVLKLENPKETEELLNQLNLKLPQWATSVHTIGGTSSSESKAKR